MDFVRTHVLLKVIDPGKRTLFREFSSRTKDSYEPIEGEQPREGAITQYFLDLPEDSLDRVRGASNVLEVAPVEDVRHMAAKVIRHAETDEPVANLSFPDPAALRYHDAEGLIEEGYHGRDATYINCDSGVSENIRRNYRVVFTTNVCSDRGPTDVTDDDGHGSMTTSIQAPFGAKLGVIRCLDARGSGTSDGIAKSIRIVGDYARDHPDEKVIANWSLGGGFSVYRYYQTEIDYARAQGACLYFSAGNDGLNRICAPANSYPGLASLAFYVPTDSRASFSNYAVGAGSATQGEETLALDKNGAFVWVDGTSFSCPWRQRLVGMGSTKHPLAAVATALDATCRDTPEPIEEEGLGVARLRTALQKIGGGAAPVEPEIVAVSRFADEIRTRKGSSHVLTYNRKRIGTYKPDA